tara:strand:- start:20986 stop:21594 length:609 start_codon:yes stop_codon:yes gene_type:complete
MTHIEYPYIEDYTALFEEIYIELGFELTIIPTPSIRGLILLDKGKVDADVIRIANTAKNYPNLIIVQPPLYNAALTLFCVKEVPCNKEVLTNNHTTIIAADNTISLLDPTEFKARQANFQLGTNIPEMLKAHRHNYALLVLDNLMESQFNSDFQMFKIKSIPVNHVIHKKHLALLEQLQQKIHTKLPQVLHKRASKIKTLMQ